MPVLANRMLGLTIHQLLFPANGFTSNAALTALPASVAPLSPRGSATGPNSIDAGLADGPGDYRFSSFTQAGAPLTPLIALTVDVLARRL